MIWQEHFWQWWNARSTWRRYPRLDGEPASKDDVDALTKQIEAQRKVLEELRQRIG